MGSVKNESQNMVLVVGDDRSLDENCKSYLCSEKYSIIIAKNESDALVKFDEYGPKNILIDDSIILENGLEMFQKIKKLNSDSLVVFMVANLSNVPAKSVRKISGVVILYKPFTIDDLIDVLI